MGIDFVDLHRSGIRDLVLRGVGQSYGYLVTPNVDDLVKTLGGRLAPHQSEAFMAADYKICDSKILVLLSNLVGPPLAQYPGSDLVRDLLDDPAFEDVLIGLIGPSAAEFVGLSRLYPNRRFAFVEAPMSLVPGTEAWDRCIDGLLEADWGIALICLPLPRQQLIAAELRTRGRARGLAMCVGASVDFLSGKQQRAPEWMRALSLEWLYRLLTNPRRLWRRYLVDGPAIFPLFFSREIWPRLKTKQ
jgi:N-acetylglucosaminyldiphosphoundecaprenol N-acetyl-beta-D-mannosaminyltransferase